VDPVPSNPMRGASALNTLKGLLLVLLFVLSVAEIHERARAMIYAPDEIHNLHPIITFYSTLDYTTTSQGGFPFDPVLSAGLLATWLNGLVFHLGGNLFTMRLLSGLTHFGVAIALAFAFLRTRALPVLDAAVIAVAIWAAMIPVGNHELRIINPGEMWGFFYLVGGTFFIRRSPRTAAFFWGLATWLVKIIYLPFAFALLVGLALAEKGERNMELFSRPFMLVVARLAFIFCVPLLMWMALIWLRYDTRTLLLWASTYVTFVAKHAAGISLNLPVYEGWRFHPPWDDPPFLSWGWKFTGPYLIPLGLALSALLVHTALRLLGWLRMSKRDAACVTAASVALLLELIWFFAFDPTHWGRHLMPAIYVAIALGIYCVVDIWCRTTWSPTASWAWGLAVYAAILAAGSQSYAFTAEYIASWGWKTSYAKACRGLDVLLPPCGHGETLLMLSPLTKALCQSDRNPFDPREDCMWRKRREYLAHAVSILETPDRQPKEVLSAGYLIMLIQAYDYYTESEFLTDIGSLICDEPAEPLQRRLEEVGFDIAWLKTNCSANTP